MKTALKDELEESEERFTDKWTDRGLNEQAKNLANIQLHIREAEDRIQEQHKMTLNAITGSGSDGNKGIDNRIKGPLTSPC